MISTEKFSLLVLTVLSFHHVLVTAKGASSKLLLQYLIIIALLDFSIAQERFSDCFFSGEYEKIEGKHCFSVDISEKFKTLLVAKMACDSNPDCVGIENRQCNGKLFVLCIQELEMPSLQAFLDSDLSNSYESSCVYMKKDTTRNIFYCNRIDLD